MIMQKHNLTNFGDIKRGNMYSGKMNVGLGRPLAREA
jgi:hypothetical protein